jgi:hypothetical protein
VDKIHNQVSESKEVCDTHDEWKSELVAGLERRKTISAGSRRGFELMAAQVAAYLTAQPRRPTCTTSY